VTLDFQIDYWNRIGPTKPFSHPVNFERMSQWIGSASRILDYGCGYGRVLGILHSNGYRNLMGVDPAPAMIAAARQNFPKISFEVLSDFRNVDLASACVDAVLLFAVLTSVPTDEGQRTILAETTRVLRPGGLLYISDMWLQTDARNLERYQEGERKHGIYGVFDLSEGPTVRHHSRERIEELTKGYDLVALDEIQVMTMNGHPSNGFQWFGRRAPSGVRETSAVRSARRPKIRSRNLLPVLTFTFAMSASPSRAG
jgi:SAM-dependent methyltransferase